MTGIMDGGNVVSMLRASVIKLMKSWSSGKTKKSGKGMSGRMLKLFKSGRKMTEKGMMKEISSLYEEFGLRETKDILKNEYGFTQMQVDKGLVWDPDTKKAHIRGSIKTTLDYEFYGVPQGVWPNARNLRKWVKDRVITRDPILKVEYKEKTEKGKYGMVSDLTFLFGRAIARDGLKRRSTTRFEPTEDPKLLDKGVTVVYKGNKVTTRQLTEEEALGKYLPPTAGRARYGNKGLKKEYR
tara:strand:- start:320 stop:1039 length:720 start_codon:yes stop_codon:yes gene_type:complete